MLLGFEDYASQTQALAGELQARYAGIEVHHFPDGESKLSLPTELPPHVVLCRSLDAPNQKLIELLLAAKTARELGASRLSLVAPYLCYMRQDQAFAPGEAVSQRIIGRFLAGLFDDVISVDPHLHRTHDIAQAIPATHSLALSAGPAMSDFLRAQNNPVLLGPDSESRQWLETIAQHSKLEYGVGSKTRLGDQEVKITLPQMSLHGRQVILIDDIISSGITMAITAQQCLAAGAAQVDVLVTHALFAPGAEQRLRAAGVNNIWSTDSITHPSNVISLASILAGALASLSYGHQAS